MNEEGKKEEEEEQEEERRKGWREGPTVLILMLKLLIPSYAKEREATSNTQKEK